MEGVIYGATQRKRGFRKRLGIRVSLSDLLPQRRRPRFFLVSGIMSSFFPHNPNPYPPINPYYPNPNPRIKPEVWERYKKQVEESEGFDVDKFPELRGIGTVVTPQGPCGEHYVESLMNAIKEQNQRRQAEGRTSITLVRPIKFNIQIYPLNLYCTFVAKDDADGTERTYQAKLSIGSGTLDTIIFREIASSDVQATFLKPFGKYGRIVDHVIMKDQYTQQPRGFGVITYDDPSVVDKVIEDNHEINGKPVEIKRTIPKGAAQAKDFKTKKFFVGGIPTTVGEDELKKFFSKFGKVVEHEIIRDHSTKRSRGFGFIIFDSEQAVDAMLSNGNMIDFAGGQVEVKKAEPKKSSNPPLAFASEPRGRPFSGGVGGYGNSYAGFGGGEFGPSYRTPGALGPRLGEYGGYGSGTWGFGGGYGGFGSGSGGYQGDSSIGYSSRFGSYGGYGRGGGYSGGALGGGYGRDEGFVGYSGSSYGSGYDSGTGSSFGSSVLYGGRGGGYGGGAGPSGGYHPCARQTI